MSLSKTLYPMLSAGTTRKTGNYSDITDKLMTGTGAQWFSGRALDSRPKGCRFDSHNCHCILSLSKTH